MIQRRYSSYCSFNLEGAVNRDRSTRTTQKEGIAWATISRSTGRSSIPKPLFRISSQTIQLRFLLANDRTLSYTIHQTSLMIPTMSFKARMKLDFFFGLLSTDFFSW